MSDIYSEKKVKELYEKIKPNRIDELEMYLRMKGIEELYPVINEVKNEITEIKSRLDRIEILSGIEEVPINVSEIKHLIGEVSNYLKENNEAYPSEIADFLDISIKDVMNALSVLKRQKKIEEVE